jgi:NAD(P)-dependent dehydrogenase (short-subunit alcohol dehydrogenase family)
MGMLTGKVALVTGAGRGVGRATALELAQRGADLAVAARSVDEIEDTATAVRAHGHRACAFPIDLSDMGATRGLVQAVEEALGPVAILVNNAAIVGPFGPSWELDPTAWEQALRVNLAAPFLLSRTVLPRMIAAGWGRIVNVSSSAAQTPLPRFGAYSSSKAGLDMLTRQLAVELTDTGVTVTTIYPGVVDTVMQAHIRSQPDETLGTTTAQQFRRLQTEGLLRPPEQSARLIAEVIGAQVPLNGRIIDITSEEGQHLVETDHRGSRRLAEPVIRQARSR